MLLFTSSPLEGSEGADKQLAAMIASMIPDMEFTWFTRWPAMGRKPRLASGHAVPIASRDGIPHTAERLQVTAAGAFLARHSDLVHAILTVGTGFPLLSRWWQLLFPSRPVIHTAPGVMEPHLLSRSRPLGTTVAYSDVTAQALRAAGFGDVRVIAPAVSLAQWPCRPRAAGIPAVLFAGHHDPGGGATEAIAAAAVARQAGAPFRLGLGLRPAPRQRRVALGAAPCRLACAAGVCAASCPGGGCPAGGPLPGAPARRARGRGAHGGGGDRCGAGTVRATGRRHAVPASVLRTARLTPRQPVTTVPVKLTRQ